MNHCAQLVLTCGKSKANPRIPSHYTTQDRQLSPAEVALVALVGNLWPKPLSLALLKLLKSKAQYHIPVPQCAAGSRPESHTGHRCWFHLHFLHEFGAWRLNCGNIICSYNKGMASVHLGTDHDGYDGILTKSMKLKHQTDTMKVHISPWNARGPAAAKPAKPQLPLEQLATAPRHKDLLKASQVIWSTTTAVVLATLHSIAGFPHNSSSLAVGRNYASSGDK